MKIGDRVVLDDGDITGEVVAADDRTHRIRWATGEVFTYTNDVDWADG